LLTLYQQKYWTHFYRTFNIGALWDKDEYFKFQGQKFKLTTGPTCWKMYFLTLKTTGLNFTKLSGNAFWDINARTNFWDQKK